MLRFPSAGVPISAADLLRGLFCRSAAPFAEALERRLDVRHAGLVGSGSGAFHLILKVLAARSGRREVIVPAYTAPVVILPVRQAGLRPVAVDVSLETFNMDPASACRLMGPDTLAVMPAHMFGMPCELSEIAEAAKTAGAALIEDAAAAFGSKLDGKPVGTIGDAGFHSFQRGKQLATVTGGAWTTDDDSLADALRKETADLEYPALRTRAALFAKMAALAVAVRPLGYTALYPLIGRYKDVKPHDDFLRCAYTAVQAGTGLSLLRKLDRITAERNRRAERARDILQDVGGVTLARVPPGAEPSYSHCPVLLPSRADRDRALAAALNTGMECTTLYDRTVYEAYGLTPEECGGMPCPQAEDLAARLLLVPCHPLLPVARVEQAAETIANTVAAGP
jgi:dTDP-4-amino-4,6-dideoxygalactose transaminase